ncbi:MAG: ABC transporter substrate-binding protein [Methylobacterium mesophilicum]|nr:ABC transporter substrate-binding protein [Methylobacterium mesophilicum]
MRFSASRLFPLAVLLMGLGAQPIRAEEPQRIVSIGGAVTEIVYALGEEKRLAAVDTTSLYPPETKALPNVGYIRALSAEGVLSLSPDMILLEDGAGPPEAVKLIDAAGVSVVHVPAGQSVEALPDKIRTVARALGRDADGEAMASKVSTDLAALEKQLGAAVKAKQKVLFILSLKDDRPLAGGENTAADAMIRLAGAENVLAGTQGYKGLSWEAASALQPDVILMMDRGGPAHGGDAFALPALAATPAGRNKRLIKMDALYLLGFGPRTPAAARDLAARLYPDLALALP